MTEKQDETEDWWWWANACGEVLWCRHDSRGEMVCGERGTEEIEPAVVDAARVAAHCEVRDIIGRKEVDRREWRVSLCGHGLDCTEIGGAWTCATTH